MVVVTPEYEEGRSSQIPLKLDTFTCRICLEFFPISDRVNLQGCGRDSHSCCYGCLGEHLQSRILEGRIESLSCPCFGSDGCSAVADEAEIAHLVNPAIMAKYRRFELMRSKPELRECPECDHVCAPDKINGRIVPDMTCPNCLCQFCHEHSTAHAPGRDACNEYTQTHGTSERIADCQNCPKCGILTARVQGCVRLHCQCGADWCWACGKEITVVGWHYNPANPQACRLDGYRVAPPGKYLMLACWLWSLPAFVVCGTLVLLFLTVNYMLRVLLFVGFLPCYCYAGDTYMHVANSITFQYAFLLFWFILPLAWGLVSLPIYGILACCGANREHFSYIIKVPHRFLGMLMELLLFQELPPDAEHGDP